MQAAHLLGEQAPVGDDSAHDDIITSPIPSHLSPWLQPINTSTAAVRDTHWIHSSIAISLAMDGAIWISF